MVQRPLHLVRVQGTEDPGSFVFEVDKDALKLLTASVAEECLVIAVVGPTGVGKSTLLSSWAADGPYEPVFPTSDSFTEPQTRGIWACVKTIDEVSCILLDVEGSDAPGQPPQLQQQLSFVLSALATHIVFNVKGQRLKASELQTLACYSLGQRQVARGPELFLLLRDSNPAVVEDVLQSFKHETAGAQGELLRSFAQRILVLPPPEHPRACDFESNAAFHTAAQGVLGDVLVCRSTVAVGSLTATLIDAVDSSNRLSTGSVPLAALVGNLGMSDGEMVAELERLERRDEEEHWDDLEDEQDAELAAQVRDLPSF